MKNLVRGTMRQHGLIAITLTMAAAAIMGTTALAQENGDAKRGAKLGVEVCMTCHGVRKGQESTDPLAPTFVAIASVRGMTPTALNVALLTSHRFMPNIVLDAQERADIIVYILSLRAD